MHGKSRRGSFTFVELLVVVAVCAVLAAMVQGCARLRTPAAIPSDQMTPVVWNPETADVLKKGLDTGGKVLASALEQNTESGSVVYVRYDGWVYNPDGTLFIDQNGKPVRLSYEVVAKLNSLKELAEMSGVDEVDYIVGGFGYIKDLPEGVKGADPKPEALRLHVKGAGGVKATDPTAANRDAAARERAAILAGLAKLAESEGAAFATRVKALADGTATMATAAGDLVGKIVSAKVMAVANAATTVVKAVVRKSDGSTQAVIAEGADAAALQAAAATP